MTQEDTVLHHDTTAGHATGTLHIAHLNSTGNIHIIHMTNSPTIVINYVLRLPLAIALFTNDVINRSNLYKQ